MQLRQSPEIGRTSPDVLHLNPPLGQLPFKEMFATNSPDDILFEIRRRHGFEEGDLFRRDVHKSQHYFLIFLTLLSLEGCPNEKAADLLSALRWEDEDSDASFAYGSDYVMDMRNKNLTEEVKKRIKQNTKIFPAATLLNPPSGSDIQKWRDILCDVTKIDVRDLFADKKVPPPEGYTNTHDVITLENTLKVGALVASGYSMEGVGQRFGRTAEETRTFLDRFSTKVRRYIEQTRRGGYIGRPEGRRRKGGMIQSTDADL